MYTKITSKKNTKTKLNSLSFIIISPCLGYKYQNRKIPIALYNNKPLVLHHVEYILNTFPNSEIFVIAGEYYNKFMEIKNRINNFSLIQNQLYSCTGECEQLRLGIQAVKTNNCIVIKENNLINFEYLKNKKFPFILINDNYNRNPGCIIENKIIKSMSYGLNNYFGGCFYINNNQMQTMYNYCSIEHNKNKLMFECINKTLLDNWEFKAI